MKKIKLIFTVLAIILLIPSCDNDGGDSKIDTQLGGVPDIQKIPETELIIDFVKVTSGDDINLGFTVDIGGGDISKMDVVLFYTKLNGDVYKAILESNVSTFPATYNITQNDLFDLFEELNEPDDFEVGDVLTVTTNVTLNNGTVIKMTNDNGTPGYGVDVSNSSQYSVIQTYNVACSSDLGGTYNVLTSGSSTDSGPTPDENPITDFATTVTLTDNGGGNYTVSDIYGGLYLLWYDIYGITPAHCEGEFDDICGTISGNFSGPFGEAVTITGTVNTDGTLSIHWVNEFDDMGDSVYTKVD